MGTLHVNDIHGTTSQRKALFINGGIKAETGWKEMGVKRQHGDIFTISRHANGEALLEATLLAAVAIDANDGAVLILQTPFVLDILLDAPTEKALEGGATSEHLHLS